jgi:hypothetical protein
MSDKIPGVPEGWELVAVRRARYMENYIWTSGMIVLWQERTESGFIVPIIRKIEKPATYRPFANAEEFKPHRDRWWYRDDKDGRRHFPPASYSDQAHGGATWKHRFETCFFDDDGTPFGVKIDE